MQINWCSHKAAKFACENWHYSKCMPVGKLIKLGVWENDKFIGCLIYSRGANQHLLKPFNLVQTQGCELTRIALKQHGVFVSQLIKISLVFLKKRAPGIRLVVSFADTEKNHHGGIYQASNWIYTGMSVPVEEYLYQGKRWHGRAFRKSFGSHLNYNVKIVMGSSKHRYIMPLTKQLRKQILKSSKPYPKRVPIQTDSGVQPEKGSAKLTRSLQLEHAG